MINLRQDNSDSDKPKLVIEIDNGDLKALTSVVDKWHFKDVASLLRFVIAVLSRSTDNVVYIKDGESSGKQSAYAPADILLKAKNSSGDADDAKATK